MTYDPNLPPSSRERLRDRDLPPARPRSTGWIIGLIVVALVVIGAFFVWPNRASNVAGGGPDRTGTTSTRPLNPTPAPSPAPTQPAPPADGAPSTPK